MSKGREGRGADVDTSLTTCPDSAAHTERERKRQRGRQERRVCWKCGVPDIFPFHVLLAAL
jgi:hypothetical protein